MPAAGQAWALIIGERPMFMRPYSLGGVHELTPLQRAVAQIIAKFRVDSIIEMDQHSARFPLGSEFRARGKVSRRCAEELEALVLKTASKLVSAADKLHNIRSISKDFREIGNRVWERFNASREETFWYYDALVEIFRKSGNHKMLVEELARAVAELHGLVEEAR